MMNSHDFHDPKSVKVCVIGAGFAGLSVAYHLLKHNEAAKNFDGSTYGSPLFDIEILEARDRIGGRVYPCNLGTGDAPIMVDMGAQWLHEAGPENPLVQLLQELNIPLLYAQKEREAERRQQNQEEEEENGGENGHGNKGGPAVESGTYTIEGTKIPDDIFIAARNFYSKSKNNYKRKNVTLNTSFQDLLNEAYQKQMNKIAEKNKENNMANGVEGDEDEDDDEGYATAQSEVDSESSSSSSSDEDEEEDEDDDEDDDDEEDGEEDQTGETDDDDSSSSGSSSSSEDEDDEEEGEGNGANKKKSEKFAKCFSNPLFEHMVNYLVHSTECYEGGRLHEISVALDDLYQEYEGTDEIPVGGYHAILQALQKYIFMNGANRQHCSIHLKCPVQDIYYESSPRSSASSRRRRGDSSGRMDSSEMTEMTDDDEADEDIKISGVRIEYTNESTGSPETLKADVCVCTLPLGVLQRDIGFHPPLPLSQEQSIDMIGMGLLDKIMMLFPYKFWDDDWFGGITCDDPTRIQNFQDVSEDYGGKPILASLLGGNVARRFDDDDEGLTDEEVMTEVMSTLRILFGETNVPDPVSYQISRWLCDPYSYGSYSFVKVGSTPEDYDRVAQPAGKTLFFAGEHTSKYHHSTVHGAWETGHREAVRLILKAKAAAAARYI